MGGYFLLTIAFNWCRYHNVGNTFDIEDITDRIKPVIFNLEFLILWINDYLKA